MADTYLMKNMNIYTEESQQTPKRINSKETYAKTHYIQSGKTERPRKNLESSKREMT